MKSTYLPTHYYNVMFYYSRNPESQAADECHETGDTTAASGISTLLCILIVDNNIYKMQYFKLKLKFWLSIHIIDLSPSKVNRDTLYVLLNFLRLVAENSEDRKGPGGEVSCDWSADTQLWLVITGRDGEQDGLQQPGHAVRPQHPAQHEGGAGGRHHVPGQQLQGGGADRDHQHREDTHRLQQGAVRAMLGGPPLSLRQVLCVYCVLYCTDLHSLYIRMHEDVPEAMDYLLRRRALLNGDEYVLSFRLQIFFS